MKELTFAPTSFDDPKLQQMVKDYYASFKIDERIFKNPAQWVGAFKDEELLAAIGFTRTPDGSVVFIAELVCDRNLAGRRAIEKLVDNFQSYCATHPDIQLVFAHCLTANTTMSEFLSRSTTMRPVSTVFACSKSDIAKENESGRWVRL